MENIEIINGVTVDWNKFKSEAKGKNLNRARQGYVELCEIVHNNGHKLLSDYINNVYKVLIDFNCGHPSHWIAPVKYKAGRGCPKCSGKCPKQAKEDFMKIVHNNGHKLLSDYINNVYKVLIDFNCGHPSHWITPRDYKTGRGCPKCSGVCSKKSKEDFINMTNENGHKVLSEYINVDAKILVDFNCGHEPHWTTPYLYKRGYRCPNCKNKGESALFNLLLEMGFEVITQYKYKDLRDKRLLSYDFYLPHYNMLIELDGEHHRNVVVYKDAEKAILSLNDRQRKDRIKDNYAKANNIPLIRIQYYKGKIELERWKKLILDKIKEIELEIA